MKTMKTLRVMRQGLICAGLLLLCSGCAYMRDRGADAADILDFGITTSAKPGFAVHLDFFNSLPVGYSNVEGKHIGWANRQAGILDFSDDSSWGAVLWGSQNLDIGELDPDNPHLMDPVRVRELRAAGNPLPVRTPRYNVGVVRMKQQKNAPPWPTFFCCRRNLHLGWIGFYLSLRPFDLVDFLTGWFGADLVGDDRTD